MEQTLIPNDVRCEELTFRDDTDPRLRLTLYWHPRADSPSPVILWFFRGGWGMGDRHCNEPALHLLKHGFAIACPDYRLSHQAAFPAQIEDCKSAVRWVRGMARHFNIDGERIGAWGDSAGGYLAAMLGTTTHIQDWDQAGPFTELPSSVQAVCDWCGPTDFCRMNDRPGAYDHDAPDSYESRFMGAPIRDIPEKVRLANPVTHINGYCPPFLIMHGQQDDAVIPEQSQLLHEALIAKGTRSEFILAPGYRHGFGKRTPKEVLEPVARFFKKELMNGCNPENKAVMIQAQKVISIRPDLYELSYHTDLSGLSPFQRILLVADGTLTKLLEAYLSEKMEVKKLSEGVLCVVKNIPHLEISPGRKVIERKILLQGGTSGKNWLYAESVIVPDRLKQSFRERLLSSLEPMGKLWLEQRMETFKEIITSGREPAGYLCDYFQIKKTDWLLCRTYLTFSGSKAIMMITEKFPESYFV